MLRYLLIIFFVGYNSLVLANDTKIIANVGGKVITSSDINERIKLLTKLEQINPRENTAQLALNQLINEQIYQRAAKQYNIKLTETEQNNSIQAVSKSLGYKDLKSFCRQHNLSFEHLNEHIINQNLWQKLIIHIIKPSIEINDSDYLSLIKDPKLIEVDFKVGHIEYLGEDIRSITNKIKNCEEFSNIIKNKFNQESENYTRAILGDINPNLFNALVTLNRGEINISSQGNSYELVMLCNKRPFFPDEEFRNKMANHIGEIKVNFQAKQLVDKLKRETFIKIF